MRQTTVYRIDSTTKNGTYSAVTLDHSSTVEKVLRLFQDAKVRKTDTEAPADALRAWLEAGPRNGESRDFKAGDTTVSVTAEIRNQPPRPERTVNRF